MPVTDALKHWGLGALILPERWSRSVARMRGAALAAGLLLLVNGVLYAGWFYPTSQALAIQRGESHKVRQQLQELFLYQRAKQDLDAMKLPSKKELPQAIGRVSTLGRRTGVAIPDMDFQPAQTASPQWAKVHLQFSARGTYAGVRRFVAALEGAEEPFAIESISLDKEGQTGQVVARLVVSIYAMDG